LQPNKDEIAAFSEEQVATRGPQRKKDTYTPFSAPNATLGCSNAKKEHTKPLNGKSPCGQTLFSKPTQNYVKKYLSQCKLRIFKHSFGKKA